MNAAKVADAVLARLGVMSFFDVLDDVDGQELRDVIIEEIGKEVVTEASVTNFWRYDRS